MASCSVSSCTLWRRPAGSAPSADSEAACEMACAIADDVAWEARDGAACAAGSAVRGWVCAWISLACTCGRSEEHTSELQSPCNLVCRLLLEKKKTRLLTATFARLLASASRNDSSSENRVSPLRRLTTPALEPLVFLRMVIQPLCSRNSTCST